MSSKFSTEFIFLDNIFKEKKELFEYAESVLQNFDLVEKGYANALEERENLFPTGLPTLPERIAIPHSYPEYVKKPFVMCFRLKEALSFIQMGSDNLSINARLVFILGFVRNDESQINFLKELMAKVSDETLIYELMQAPSNTAFFEIISHEKGEGK